MNSQTVGDWQRLEITGYEADPNNPHIKYYWDVQQRSDKWYELRNGVITASTMARLLKKKTDKKTGEVIWSVPETDTVRAYIYELAAQRLNGWAAETYQSYAMQRGELDEVDAFTIYSEKYEQLRTCGFIVNTEHKVAIGFSPDGLTALNDDGGIEAKSRDPKIQIETIAENEMPEDCEAQVQTAMLVTKRKWWDYVSYAGGMPMFVKRIYPDPLLQDVIILAAQKAEKEVQEIVAKAQLNIKTYKFQPTKKRVEDITA